MPQFFRPWPASVHLEGAIPESSGIITGLMINDSTPVPFYPQAGGGGMDFKFSKPLTLHGGSNAITVVAYDGGGNQGSASLTLTWASFVPGPTRIGTMANIICPSTMTTTV